MIPSIRNRVYCSLGKVLEGSFSDDYLQQNGVIRTSGTVTLDGIYAPSVGDKVQFAAYRDGLLWRLPRTLRVLSYFANPYDRTTTVEIGCKFTYFANRKPPEENPRSQDENTAIDCSIYNKAIIPISASFVFSDCLAKLGLTSDPIPLTNKFSVEEFDLTPGYVQVMSDLLSSEGYFCYLDEDEVVRIESLNSSNNLGPLLTGSDLIDFTSLGGTGNLPTDTVIVKYNSLTLKKPEDLPEDEQAKKDWEYESSTSFNEDIKIRTWKRIQSGNPSTASPGFVAFLQDASERSFKDYSISETITQYDAWDRVSVRETVVQKPFVSASPSVVKEILDYNFWQNYGKLPPSAGPADQLFSEINTETYIYKYNPGSEFDENSPNYDPCAKAKIPEQGSKEYDSLVQKIQTVAAPIFTREGESWIIEPGSRGKNVQNDFTPIVVEKTIEYYETEDTKVTINGEVLKLLSKYPAFSGVAEANKVTKQKTERYVSRYKTTPFQRFINNVAGYSAETYNPTKAIEISKDVSGLSLVSTDYTQSVGRGAFVESRPSRADRANTANAKEEVTESVAEIEFVTGSTESETTQEFTLPYAPDDEITYTTGIGYGLIKSDAKAKASNYGVVQNALLIGNRYGVSIQTSPDTMPIRPFSPLYIEEGGYIAQYRINGTSYTFNSSGIIASTDALFWGGLAR